MRLEVIENKEIYSPMVLKVTALIGTPKSKAPQKPVRTKYGRNERTSQDREIKK